jgi:uncharacterized protein
MIGHAITISGMVAVARTRNPFGMSSGCGRRARSVMFCEGLTGRGGAPPVDISSHLIQRMLGLPPPATRDLVIERGAFPRYGRNPGTGEARATATALRRADQEVYLDRAHPSAIILPVQQAR